eukprot:2788102-Rhodomonas_salina.4
MRWQRHSPPQCGEKGPSSPPSLKTKFSLSRSRVEVLRATTVVKPCRTTPHPFQTGRHTPDSGRQTTDSPNKEREKFQKTREGEAVELWDSKIAFCKQTLSLAGKFSFPLTNGHYCATIIVQNHEQDKLSAICGTDSKMDLWNLYCAQNGGTAKL